MHRFRFKIPRLKWPSKNKLIAISSIGLCLALIGILVMNSFTPYTYAAVTHQETLNGTSISATTVTVSSVNGGTDQLYLVAVSIYGGGITVSSISGGTGVTWNSSAQIAQCSSRITQPQLEIWQGVGSPGASFTVTVNLSGTPSRASAAVSRYSGYDTSNPTTAAAANNTNAGSCTGGTDTNSPSLNITSTQDNSVIFAALQPRTRTITSADVDYTERVHIVNNNGTEGADLYVHDRTLATAGTDTIAHTMSSTSDWIMAGLAINPLPVATSTPTPTPDLGSLSMLWKFDVGTGTTANDTSSMNNTGTLGVGASAPTWTTEDMCASGKCLKFDGTNDYVSRAYSSDTELNPGTGGFTVSARFKHPTAVTGTDVILARANTGTGVNALGYKIYMNSTGNVCFGIDDTAGSFPSDSACSTSTYLDSQWHSVIGVKNSTTSIVLYIDGKQVAIDSSIASGSLSASSPTFYVGVDNDASSNPWDGFIDEVAYYGVAKSAAQVMSLAIPGAGPKGSSAVLGLADNSFLNNGLMGYWKMDDNVSGNAKTIVDSSGNGNNGSTNYGANTANMDCTVGGKIGRGCSFDGTDDYISVADSASLDTPNAMTISLWIYFRDTAGLDERFISKDWDIKENTKKLQLDLGGGFYQINETLTDNAWNHVVVTVDKLTEIPNSIIYLNGKVGTLSSTNITSTITRGTTDNVNIGRNVNTASNYAKSIIDETRLYNRVLSPAEVSALYNWGPGPMAYYPFDENTGTATISDISSSGFTGTMTGSIPLTAWGPGKFGSALTFDGTNDEIDVNYPTGSNLWFNGSHEYTVSAWIKGPTNGAGNTIVKKGNNSKYIFDLGYDTGDNSVNFARYDGTNVPFASGSTAINDNRWHYVTGVRTATTLYVYIDGKVDGTAPDNTNAGIGASDPGTALTIGGRGGFYYKGAVDDVKIYNYARAPGQIIEDMNANHPLGSSPVGSQAGYWKFNEGSGTSANDSGPYTNTMTLSTATSAWTNNGKFNRAWDGNGARYVSRADDADFDFAANEDFTVSAWIKSDTGASGTQYMVNKAAGTAPGYSVYGLSTGKVAFGIDDDTSWTPDDQAISQTSVFDQAWHYVAARKTGTSRIDIFVDGKLEASDSTIAATGTLANSVALFIGDRDGVDNGDEFFGDVDEVKIYRAALTNEQINVDYNRGKSTVLGSTSTASDGITSDNSSAREYCIPGDTTTCSSPIGEWTFNEGVGSTANDTSGANVNGGINGSVTQNQWVGGKKGNALSFDGTNDYVQADNATQYDMGTSTPFTVSMWFQMTGATAQTRHLFDSIPSGTSNHFRLQLNGGFLRAQLVDSGGSTFCTIRTATNPEDGKWHHVEAIFNRNAACTTSDIIIYLDGAKESTTLVTTGLNLTANIDSTGIRIGGNTSFFQGPIDDVKLYNYVRTQGQIEWDYNRGAPVGWYRLDECGGTTAYNAALNNNGQVFGQNGTITIGASGTNTSAGTCTGASSEAWKNGAVGKVNSSINLDGSSDYVTIPDNNAMDFTTSQDFGVTIWVKIPASQVVAGNGEGSILDKGNTTTYPYRIRFDAASGTYYATRGDATNLPACGNNTSIADNTWHHIGFTKVGSTLNCYLDGQRVDSVTDTTTGTTTNANSIYIGQRGDDQRILTASIDELQFYNYGISSYQVKNIYNNGAVSFK